MDRRMIGIVLLSGVFHFVSPLHHPRYHFIKESKTWLEAQQYCSENHTDLATVNDEQDLEELASLVGSDASQVFIGLYKSWGWSVSDADDHKEGEPAYWKWASDEPKGYGCGYTKLSGEWYAGNCKTTLKFICYRGKNDTLAVLCGPNTNPKPDTSKRFIMGDDFRDWPSAQAFCRERHTDLARVRNQLENEALIDVFNQSQIWIGLTQETLVWSDGREPSFIPWRPQEPQIHGASRCATLEVNSKPLGIVDKECTEQLPFVCYSDPLKKYLVKVKLGADDSVDMADPAVLESILKTVTFHSFDEFLATCTKSRNYTWCKNTNPSS
ncbi:putative C-type lectin domain family 20 member A [Eleginops maclovinus]|uniref:putative C-type lectin domain family 20 member A n=1 Tax=Eleginops maclovinus TaxID=56733 RepID=UPI003080B035